MIRRLALVALAAGCAGEPKMACPTDDQVLVEQGGESLVCADVAVAEGYAELLAGRGLGKVDRLALRQALADEFAAAPAATGSRLGSIRAQQEMLARAKGLDGGEAISSATWEELAGRGVLTASLPAAIPPLRAAVAPWRVDDAERLVLGETSIEAWIHYASLCREVQNAPPLKLSVADRVRLYRAIGERFDAEERPGKVAMVNLGPFWDSIRGAWQAAPYERQQEWIRQAPLPPPMTTDSVGYALAVIGKGNPTEDVEVLHRSLGPLVPRPMR